LAVVTCVVETFSTTEMSGWRGKVAKKKVTPTNLLMTNIFVRAHDTDR
jgi:hypothetical protein